MIKKSIVAVSLTCLLTLLLVACGGSGAVAAGKLEGIYSNAENTASVEFRPDGKAHLSLSGAGSETTYKVEGNKVTVMVEDEELVLTLGDDGALTGPDGFFSRLTKK